VLRLRAVDEVLDVGAGAQTQFSILGCHPSKEVIFLVAGAFHVVAYHLGGGKVQYLGRIVSLGDGDRVEAAIPYRPCTVDALPSYTWRVFSWHKRSPFLPPSTAKTVRKNVLND